MQAIWVAADYNDKILQDLIHALKYKYIEGISEDLAILAVKYLQHSDILSRFEINETNTMIIPVPLHHKRFLTRGFNQSELIADQIGRLLNLHKVNLLKRIKNTETQINLKRVERQNNVKEAFSLNNSSPDLTKKVILIDDVVTTGSTLKECAKVLASAGFKEIYGLVIAQRED
ncbi:MAG: ComF family protein [Candidatus Parcubacteria bacterium]|nr:ComF family protein [Candidatus Parcubacteria bacterium]